MRTQQILAYESGVANTVDPLGGSYFVERLTLDMEQGAFDYFDKLDAMGGMVRAIERGFPQKEIADASYAYQRAVEKGEKIIVGVNEYVGEEEPPEILRIGESVREWQTDKLQKLRAWRSSQAVSQLGCTSPCPGPGATRRRWRSLSRKHHALCAGLCTRLCHPGRNLRRHASGPGHLPGGQHLLTPGGFVTGGRNRG